MKRVEKKKKNTTKWIIAASTIFILMLGIGGVYYYFNVFIPQNKYNQALEYMSSEKYSEAIDIFMSISNFKDSVKQIDNCQQLINEERYQMAVLLKNYKSYAAAIEVFKLIEDYKDSSQQILICQHEDNEERYQNALNLYSTGSYIEAINSFSRLSDYKESLSLLELSKEKLYNQAMEQMNSKNLDLAKSSFQFLASYNYSDSFNRVIQCDALSQFLILYEAIENDTSGYYANVTYKSDAQQAIVTLERMYKTNSSDEVIKQLYYVASIVSLVKITENGKDTSEWSKENYPQIEVYARQIDRNYSGPMATEIIDFANTYFYVSASAAASQKTKTYFDLSVKEKSDIIAYIYSRYQYYDAREGKATGEKYTKTVMQEAANQFDLLRVEINMVWSDQEAIDYYNNHNNNSNKSYIPKTNVSNNSIQYEPVTDGNIKSYLFSVSKEQISQRLKSPSSAKFPYSYNSNGITYNQYNKDNTTYYVVSMNVEAQNSFGATINSTFTIEYKKVETGNDWALSIISINER